MSAIQQILIDHIDIWTAAETEKKSGRGRSSGNGVSVYGIKKLRELIFELAALGRLVDEDIHQFAKLVRLGEVAEFVMGQAPPGSECNTNGLGTIFVKTGEFGSLYPEVCEWTTKPLKFAKTGDVLICVVGATVGKLNLAIDCAIGRSVAAIRPVAQLDTKYMYFALMPFTLRLRAQSRGSAQGVIGKAELDAVQIRLPSVDEQHRIVAKVDELMALCDQLEAQHNNAAEAHEKLVSHLLDTLTQSQSTDDFSANWQRIAARFDTLFTTEASIDALKQTLLQLAVMGKLVPQDPNDEPASELLKRIQAEKARLIAEGKIKKDKPLPPISDEEKPFELPQGWEWVRLGELVEKSGAGWSPNCEGHPRVGNDWGVLKVSAVSWDKFLPDENKALPKMLEPRLDCAVETGDFLVSRANTAELVAKSVVVDECPPNLMLSDKIVRLRLSQYCDKRFINNANSSLFARDYYSEVAGGTSSSMKNVSREQILNLVIGNPPLAEQHRIVTKIDELILLCEQLKSRITQASLLQQKLANVVVERATAS